MLSLQLRFLGKVWRKSRKNYIRVPREYWGVVGEHNHLVTVKLIVSDDEYYTLRGLVKRYKTGVYIKLPPEAEALKGRAVRIAVML